MWLIFVSTLANLVLIVKRICSIEKTRSNRYDCFMKNFIVFSLIVFEAIFAFQGYKNYCTDGRCRLFSVNSFFEDYPQVGEIDFKTDEAGISINISLSSGVAGDSLKLFIDSFETPYEIVDGEIVVENYELDSDKIAYFVWQGVKMPDFIIEKPYFILNSLNYFGAGKFSIIEEAEAFYSYGDDFVSLGKVTEEFIVPADEGNLKLRFTSDGLNSKDILVKFDMNSRPLISEVLSDGGFLPGKEIKVRGVNLNDVTIDNKNLIVIYSGANEVVLEMGKNLNPGDEISFRLYSDAGYSNSAAFKAYSFVSKMSGAPVITGIFPVKTGVKISGTFSTDVEVFYNGSPLEIYKVSPGWVSVSTPKEFGGFFTVSSGGLISDPAGQTCNLSSFQTCYFSN